MATTPSKPPAQRPKARFRLRLTAGDTVAIGPGKIDLLEAILETGSLTSAAKSIDMSYRRAWVLIDELNNALKTPAVASARGGERGGGSVVTPVGLQLLNRYRSIEKTAAQACQSDIRALVALLATPDETSGTGATSDRLDIDAAAAAGDAVGRSDG
jgi:molybdate transport system regulatory protein